MTVATENALARYWVALGLKPGTRFDQLETHYYLLLEKFPKNPTEDEQRQLDEMSHAFGVLRRACAPKESVTRKTISLAKRKAAAIGFVLVAGSAVLVAMNWKEIRVATSNAPNGATLRVNGKSDVFGTVEGFASHHVFDNGKAGPAYQIRRNGTGEVVWVGERTVELGMTY